MSSSFRYWAEVLEVCDGQSLRLRVQLSAPLDLTVRLNGLRTAPLSSKAGQAALNYIYGWLSEHAGSSEEGRHQVGLRTLVDLSGAKDGVYVGDVFATADRDDSLNNAMLVAGVAAGWERGAYPWPEDDHE